MRTVAAALFTAAVAAALVYGVARPAPATASGGGYEQVVDITFPVDGPNSYVNDYNFGRSGGRAHRATDIMAAYGQPVHAAVGGKITWITGLNGTVPWYGYMITIAGDDGRRYHYVHLGRNDRSPDEAYAPGMREGVRVERGQHIGFVGCSGNASCAGPHLHFEIEDSRVRDPYGSSYINPFWSLREAQKRGDVPGATAPQPLTGDWNGDGVVTPGWFTDGTFRLAASDGSADLVFEFGQPGDRPVVGDWNGDGVTTVGIVRGNVWSLRNANSSGAYHIRFPFGRATDTPVTGDWNGNGITTAGLVRGNVWYLRENHAAESRNTSIRYGRADDTPIAGDWTGDGTTNLGVVRENVWYLSRQNNGGSADIAFKYGRADDLPVVGDWTADGLETPAVVRDTAVWYLRHEFDGGSADETERFEAE